MRKPWCERYGRLRVNLCDGRGKVRKFFVHHLVLMAFVGPRPEGMECCHDPDPDPSNCKLGNLRWDTRAGNTHDKVKMGRQAKGSGHGRAKLCEDDILRILALVEMGATQESIARSLGVAKSTIWYVATGLHWKHVKKWPKVPDSAP